MANKIAIELDQHKIEFELPEGYEYKVNESNRKIIALKGDATRIIYTEILPYDHKITDKNKLEMETKDKVEKLMLEGSAEARIATSPFLSPPTTSTLPNVIKRDGHEARYLRIHDSSGKIVERFFYWLDDHFMCDIIFVYLKSDEEIMRRIIGRVMDTLGFMEPGDIQIGEDLFVNMSVWGIIEIKNKARRITFEHKGETHDQLRRKLEIVKRDIKESGRFVGSVFEEGLRLNIRGLDDSIRITLGDSFVIVKPKDIGELYNWLGVRL